MVTSREATPDTAAFALQGSIVPWTHEADEDDNNDSGSEPKPTRFRSRMTQPSQKPKQSFLASDNEDAEASPTTQGSRKSTQSRSQATGKQVPKSSAIASTDTRNIPDSQNSSQIRKAESRKLEQKSSYFESSDPPLSDSNKPEDSPPQPVKKPPRSTNPGQSRRQNGPDALNALFDGDDVQSDSPLNQSQKVRPTEATTKPIGKTSQTKKSPPTAKTKLAPLELEQDEHGYRDVDAYDDVPPSRGTSPAVRMKKGKTSPPAQKAKPETVPKVDKTAKKPPVAPSRKAAAASSKKPTKPTKSTRLEDYDDNEENQEGSEASATSDEYQPGKAAGNAASKPAVTTRGRAKNAANALSSKPAKNARPDTFDGVEESQGDEPSSNDATGHKKTARVTNSLKPTKVEESELSREYVMKNGTPFKEANIVTAGRAPGREKRAPAPPQTLAGTQAPAAAKEVRASRAEVFPPQDTAITIQSGSSSSNFEDIDNVPANFEEETHEDFFQSNSKVVPHSTGSRAKVDKEAPARAAGEPKKKQTASNKAVNTLKAMPSKRMANAESSRKPRIVAFDVEGPRHHQSSRATAKVPTHEQRVEEIEDIHLVGMNSPAANEEHSQNEDMVPVERNDLTSIALGHEQTFDFSSNLSDPIPEQETVVEQSDLGTKKTTGEPRDRAEDGVEGHEHQESFPRHWVHPVVREAQKLVQSTEAASSPHRLRDVHPHVQHDVSYQKARVVDSSQLAPPKRKLAQAFPEPNPVKRWKTKHEIGSSSSVAPARNMVVESVVGRGQPFQNFGDHSSDDPFVPHDRDAARKINGFTRRLLSKESEEAVIPTGRPGAGAREETERAVRGSNHVNPFAQRMLQAMSVPAANAGLPGPGEYQDGSMTRSGMGNDQNTSNGRRPLGEADEQAWKDAANEYPQGVDETMHRIVTVLLRNLKGKESALDDVVTDYRTDGTRIVQRLSAKHAQERDRLVHYYEGHRMEYIQTCDLARNEVKEHANYLGSVDLSHVMAGIGEDHTTTRLRDLQKV